MEEPRSNAGNWREVKWYVISIVIVLVIASTAVAVRLIGLFGSPLSAETFVQVPATRGNSQVSATNPSSTFRLAVAPVISPQKSVQAYRELANFLGRRLGREPVLLQSIFYAQANELLRNHGCDLALVCTYAFVRGEREFGMQALAMPVIRGSRTYRSLVIVPKSPEDLTLTQLRGKRFASADLMSTSGWLFPATWLTSNGINPEGFFGQHLITRSHDQAITAVASGYVEGAAVVSSVYQQMLEEDPGLRNELKVILVSPPFGTPPLVCHPKIDPSLRDQIQNLLVHMDQNEEGRRVLAKLKFDRFVTPDRHDHDSVRKLVSVWESR